MRTPDEILRLDHEVSALHSVRACLPLRFPRLDFFALHLDEVGVEGGDVPAFTGSLDDLDGFDDIAIEIRDMTNKVHADLIQMEREEIEARDVQRMAGANGMQGGNLVIEP